MRLMQHVVKLLCVPVIASLNILKPHLVTGSKHDRVNKLQIGLQLDFHPVVKKVE